MGKLGAAVVAIVAIAFATSAYAGGATSSYAGGGCLGLYQTAETIKPFPVVSTTPPITPVPVIKGDIAG